MNSFFDKLYDALRSLKLAIFLLALIALFAIVGGIVPQNNPTSFYLERFSSLGARLILALGLYHVFSSVPFLFVVALFAMNLTVCTLHRLSNEFSKPLRKRQHGPDILHIGLLILIFGGILTARTRTETLVNLRRGESTDLPDGSKLVLIDLIYEKYADGRPKSWESVVAIDSASNGRITGKSGSETSAQRSIKVNAPFRGKGYSIYQQDWHNVQQVELSDAMGLRFQLEPGDREAFDGGFLLFMTTENAISTDAPSAAQSQNAIFLLEKGGKRTVVKSSPGTSIGPFTYQGIIDQSVSGLALVSDRGYPFVAAGFALVILGLFLTYFKKLKGILT